MGHGCRCNQGWVYKTKGTGVTKGARVGLEKYGCGVRWVYRPKGATGTYISVSLG